MKQIFTALLVFITIVSIVSVAYAAFTRIVLIDTSEQALGTDANPIYIQGV